MQTIINRSPLTISIDTDGAITVTLNSAPLAMPFGTKIKALSEVKGSGTAALVAAAKAKGGTHLMGSRVALLPGEADLIAAALASHPALIAKDAAFRLSVSGSPRPSARSTPKTHGRPTPATALQKAPRPRIAQTTRRATSGIIDHNHGPAMGQEDRRHDHNQHHRNHPFRQPRRRLERPRRGGRGLRRVPFRAVSRGSQIKFPGAEISVEIEVEYNTEGCSPDAIATGDAGTLEMARRGHADQRRRMERVPRLRRRARSWPNHPNRPAPSGQDTT